MDSAPFETSAIDEYPSKTAWDAAAAELVATMLSRWHLTPGEAFVGGEAAAVLAVTTRDGEDAVLKVGFPHVEGVFEAVGLEAFGPGLAPRVLRQDAWTWSLLLERVRPGVPLSRLGLPADETIRMGGVLHARLAGMPVPAGVPMLPDLMRPFVVKAEVALPSAGLGPDAGLVSAGLEEYHRLLELNAGDALLHGDFNPGNVLSDGAGWKVIDPKPMVGDPAFDLPPLVEELGSGLRYAQSVSAAHVVLAAEASGCDAGRLTRWGFARASLDAIWYLEDGHREGVASALRRARAWRALSGS